MQKISPFLWFDNNAEEAVKFYLSVFKSGCIVDELRAGSNGPGPKGSIITISFQLEGQRFMALNGGPHFKFNEAVSFVVRCETQEEIDYYWDALTKEGGTESQCGWLKDKFGLSWQIVPAEIGELLRHPAAMKAMMGMKKLDIGELKRAGGH